MTNHMDELYTLLNDNNIDLRIIIYPWPNQIYHNDFNSMHVNIWENWSIEKNVKFLNLFPSFFSKNLTDKNQKLDIIEKYYFKWDIHFNKEGNRLVAEKFLKDYF